MVKPAIEIIEEETPKRYMPNANDIVDQFTTQIRNRPRTVVTEDGEERTYTVAKQIGKIENTWDDDLSEGMDEANELLKKFTKVSQRTRPPVRMVEVKCDGCNKVEKIHPLHAGARSRHLCNRCIGHRSHI